ncbi:hypothetical protein L1987_10617 [Smallanthus sonchifolius]|uniref:Uncharacterized protein n=1 Tax=Smallanthus sonchifolius TaxID=185202 RepID=A0ACB9JSL0_9ASTR|nr:hypothetical protein L1987_10617 [Smallanthus sonchifolius]
MGSPTFRDVTAALFAFCDGKPSPSFDQALHPMGYMVNNNCIPPMCNLLTSDDLHTVHVVLDALENILKSSPTTLLGGYACRTGSVNFHATLVTSFKGKENIESLLSHINEEIKEKAIFIVKGYWRSRQ